MKTLDNLTSSQNSSDSNTTKKCRVILKAGVDKNAYFNKVSSVVDEFDTTPDSLKVLCTEEQQKTLNADPQVKFVVDEGRLKTKIVDLGFSKPVNVKRNSKRHLDEKDWDYQGNWGLIRHSSLINNLTTNDVKTTETYTANYDGTGVDLVLIGRSQLTANDPYYMNVDGTSRLQQFQWNSLPTLSTLPTIDYSLTELDINTHSEQVLYCAASNEGGWATGAHIYVWPTQTMEPAGVYTWEAFQHIKIFHENKIANGNSRPTVVVCSLGAVVDASGEEGLMQGMVYRDKVYTHVSPSGSGNSHVSNMDTNTNGAFPRMVKFSAGFVADEDEHPALFTAIDNKDHAAVKAILDDPEENPWYHLGEKHCQEMMDAGVHYVKSAGNSSESLVHEGHPDYNNCHIGMEAADDEAWAERRYLSSNSRQDGLLACKDTIQVGALSADMLYNDGEEKLARFSCRGPRIDAVAVGAEIMMPSFSRTEYYGAGSDLLQGYPEYLTVTSGTSFASPQIAGMACLVLEKYPNTTPKQMKRYFRYIAAGTDELLDSYPPVMAESTKFGDAPYYSSTGLHGYSGRIAYLDPTLDFDPTSLDDTSIVYANVTTEDTSLDYTVDQINTKLSNV